MWDRKKCQSQQSPASRACISFFKSSNVTGSDRRGDVCTFPSHPSRGDVWHSDSRVSVLHWIATPTGSDTSKGEVGVPAATKIGDKIGDGTGESGNNILGMSAEPSLGGVEMNKASTLGKSASTRLILVGPLGPAGIHGIVVWMGVETRRLRRPSGRWCGDATTHGWRTIAWKRISCVACSTALNVRLRKKGWILTGEFDGTRITSTIPGAILVWCWSEWLVSTQEGEILAASGITETVPGATLVWWWSEWVVTTQEGEILEASEIVGASQQAWQRSKSQTLNVWV
jgi:hypothetical protein